MDVSENPNEIVRNLASFMLSYEHFTKKSYFPFILYNTFESLDPTDFTTMLSTLKDSDNKNAAIRDTLNTVISTYTDISSVEGYISKSTGMIKPAYNFFFPASPTSTDNLFTEIVDSYTDPLPALGPAMNDTVINTYIRKMQRTFSVIYFVIYRTVATKLVDLPGDYSALRSALPNSSFADIIAMCKDLCDKLFVGENFNTMMSLDDYVSQITSNVYNTNVNNVIVEPYKRQLFLIVFYPYMVFKYLTNFIIPSPVMSSTFKGSRNVYVRRAAILAVYMFHSYFFFSLYVLSARISPSSDHTQKLRVILDSNGIHTFNQEILQNSRKDYQQIETVTESAFAISSQISEKNREIELSRNNIHTAIKADANAKNRLKKAVIIKWVWFALLVNFLIGFGVLSFFIVRSTGKGKLDLARKLVSAGNISCTVVVVVLCIFGIYYVAKKF